MEATRTLLTALLLVFNQGESMAGSCRFRAQGITTVAKVFDIVMEH